MPALASPRLALDSPSIDFGEVAANAALVREVRVGNAGDAPLRVSEIRQDPRAPQIKVLRFLGLTHIYVRRAHIRGER